MSSDESAFIRLTISAATPGQRREIAIEAKLRRWLARQVSLHFWRVCHREPQSYTSDCARPTRHAPSSLLHGRPQHFHNVTRHRVKSMPNASRRPAIADQLCGSSATRQEAKGLENGKWEKMNRT